MCVHLGVAAAMQMQIGELSTRLEKVRVDLLKWSFLFWVAAFRSIAGLAEILR